MTDETMIVTRTVAAPPETVFAVLADPSRHAAIDGTGWVRESLDGERLTAPGQVFRIAMYHSNHPDGHYEMANRVEVLDPSRTIAWQPGQDDGAGTVEYGGWVWRYDLAPLGDTATTVTLTYDWSGVPAFLREHIVFPPFGVEHLENSLAHLDELATGPVAGRS
ncbi:SRPBCC family protein [Pseudonocardia nantongensis]|uniref:SRPBCC family protein n=1 Tax=Pseudonocardia nantongensis TaxID=1181885 RepID=UPI00397BBBFE